MTSFSKNIQTRQTEKNIGETICNSKTFWRRCVTELDSLTVCKRSTALMIKNSLGQRELLPKFCFFHISSVYHVHLKFAVCVYN